MPILPVRFALFHIGQAAFFGSKVQKLFHSMVIFSLIEVNGAKKFYKKTIGEPGVILRADDPTFSPMHTDLCKIFHGPRVNKVVIAKEAIDDREQHLSHRHIRSSNHHRQ